MFPKILKVFTENFYAFTLAVLAAALAIDWFYTPDTEQDAKSTKRRRMFTAVLIAGALFATRKLHSTKNAPLPERLLSDPYPSIMSE